MVKKNFVVSSKLSVINIWMTLQIIKKKKKPIFKQPCSDQLQFPKRPLLQSTFNILAFNNRQISLTTVSYYPGNYRVCHGFRLAKQRWLFLSHFWPLLKQVSFFWGSWDRDNSANRLEPKTKPILHFLSKLGLSKSVIHTLALVKDYENRQLGLLV